MITTTIYKNAKIVYTHGPDMGLGKSESFQIDRIDPKITMGIKLGEEIEIVGVGRYRVCELNPFYGNVSALEKI